MGPALTVRYGLIAALVLTLACAKPSQAPVMAIERDPPLVGTLDGRPITIAWSTSAGLLTDAREFHLFDHSVGCSYATPFEETSPGSRRIRIVIPSYAPGTVVTCPSADASATLDVRDGAKAFVSRPLNGEVKVLEKHRYGRYGDPIGRDRIELRLRDGTGEIQGTLTIVGCGDKAE